MMRWCLLSAVLLLLLATQGSASTGCETEFKYCMNYTMPTEGLVAFQSFNVTLGGAIGGSPCLSFPAGSDQSIPSTTPWGECYAWDNLSNVFIGIDDGGTVNWEYKVINISTGPDQIYMIADPIVSPTSTTPGKLTVCLNGTTTSYNHGTVDDAAGLYLFSPDSDDYNQYYSRNWTFRWEENNSIINASKENLNMKIWCDGDYAENTINLSTNQEPNLIFYTQTFVEPKFITTFNSLAARIRQDIDVSLVDNYYILGSDANAAVYSFDLLDYTGGECYKSALAINGPISNVTEGAIHVERFQQDNIIRPLLLNDTQYSLNLQCDGSTRSLGNLFISDADLSREVWVTTPAVGPFNSKWTDFGITITTDWANSQVGCNVNSSNSEDATIKVWNTSGDLEYSDDNTATNTAFTTAVIDNNGSFTVQCTATSGEEGYREVTKTFNLRNETALWKGFDLNIPATVMGIPRATLYSFTSLGSIIMVGGLFSAASFGVGAIMIAVMTTFFSYVAWLPLPATFLGLIWWIAIFIKIKESRKGESV